MTPSPALDVLAALDKALDETISRAAHDWHIQPWAQPKPEELVAALVKEKVYLVNREALAHAIYNVMRRSYRSERYRPPLWEELLARPSASHKARAGVHEVNNSSLIEQARNEADSILEQIGEHSE